MARGPRPLRVNPDNLYRDAMGCIVIISDDGECKDANNARMYYIEGCGEYEMYERGNKSLISLIGTDRRNWRPYTFALPGDHDDGTDDEDEDYAAEYYDR